MMIYTLTHSLLLTWLASFVAGMQQLYLCISARWALDKLHDD
jgi:hypothetical protein